ncbi:MAG: valine--tRNA ligase [Lachnospiraceae bacterium]|nr:valine--tRNA ligase [Lachnospiraceae bacterium]
MANELAKTYEPQAIEGKIYQRWLEKRYFHAEVDPKKKPFCIVMPPPNITGQLHMGHALDNTLQDILTRWKRMQGYSALWQPGTDHAAISTEVKILAALAKKDITKDNMTREEFLEYAWEWKKEYGGRIVTQLKKMGSSADWERERFTMDEGCSKAVREVFVRLYEKGLIYKGSRIINWCPECQTSISDAEVEHVDENGHFWHIRYPIVGEDGFVEIATTRPETLLGDTAVAVNPEDERYTHLIGKMLELPLTGRQIPVIADAYVDKEFGTGCVKITPAHDPNDFEVGKRHGLEEINVLNDDATINENGGKYAGMDRYECRKALVADLEAAGLLVKVVDHQHAVGHHDRCGCTVEPMIKPQWFVAMEELAKPAIEAVKKGDMKFVPDRFDKIYFHWLENIRDWCISRQLWWGHRIPAWTCEDCGEIIVGREDPTVCPKCGSAKLTQDPDTLDTWFSSALWPFSTLGWPEKTPELEYFYPTDVLVTGYDIIFFWVIRMMFSGLEQMGDVPFRTTLIHGLVRDSQGRKMSKSLGNGIDPLEVIDKFGADALRLTLITGNTPGNDMRFFWERVEASRNFANKIWNASRFIRMKADQYLEAAGKWYESSREDLEIEDRWIISKVNDLAKEVTRNMESFELGIAVQKVYDFIWEEFCDWYIEILKDRLNVTADSSDEKLRSASVALQTLNDVLIRALKLLHPYMPFITEELFTSLQDEEESIMISSWPEWREEDCYPDEEAAVEHMKDAVIAVRKLRNDMNVPPAKKAHVIIASPDVKFREEAEILSASFRQLLSAEQVQITDEAGAEAAAGDQAVSAVIHGAVVYMPLADLVDFEKERERLTKEKARLEGELKRSRGMLSNEKFLSKAPADKVEAEKEKLGKYEQMMQTVEEQLAKLG